MNASYDLRDLNVLNDARLTALTHLRINSFTPERSRFEPY